jgi:hypothetical protein
MWKRPCRSSQRAKRVALGRRPGAEPEDPIFVINVLVDPSDRRFVRNGAGEVYRPELLVELTSSCRSRALSFGPGQMVIEVTPDRQDDLRVNG